MRVDLLNNKGGVGKTLVTVALAEAFAHKGKRVLVVDMDPQANATRRLRVDPAAPTLTDALMLGVRNSGAADYVTPCGWSTAFAGTGAIDVLPSDLDLEDRAIEAGMPGASNRLRRALYGVDDEYDFTLIDCPPSIKGHLTVNALAALDADDDTILCPVTPEYDAVAGAQRAITFVEQWGDELGTRARVTGLIANAVRKVNVHEVRVSQFAEAFPGLPLLGSIPLRARVAEQMDSAQPLGDDPNTAVAVETMNSVADFLIARKAQYA